MEPLLLAWYDRSGRDLPWRHTRDPYAILVSEVMLQQTQVDRVVPRYRSWLERWPTVDALAAASPAEVIVEWQGLGYNRRALALHRAATHVAAHGWPEDLMVLPGVGPYTAAAVRNFALRRGGAAARRQRRARAAPHGPDLLGRRRAGAHGPRRDDLPRPNPTLRRVPARRRVPVTRHARRAGPEAVPFRRLVPPAPGRCPSSSRNASPAGRAPRAGGGRRPRARRARRRPRRSRLSPRSPQGPKRRNAASIARRQRPWSYPGRISGYRGRPSSGISSQQAAYATKARDSGRTPGSPSIAPSRTPV